LAIGLQLLAKLASPSPELKALLKDIADWIPKRCPELHPEIHHGKVQDSPAIFCKLHPGAEEVVLSLVNPEHLAVTATTSTVGPGYHIYLVSLLKELSREFHASWYQSLHGSENYGDETGYFFSSDEQQVFRQMAGWLQGVAKLFFDGTLDSSTSGIALNLSSNALFESDQPAITPLGPRSREWLYQVSQDGAQGKDFFSWWTPGLNAEFYLGRALTLMWSTVRWRPPVSEAETEVLKRVAGSLAKAYELNPGLPYPWAEWDQVLGWLDASGPEREMVHSQAKGTPTIGYRRGHVTVGLTGGWRMRIPGAFSEFEFDQKQDLFALDPPREIWFTSFRLPTPLTDEKLAAIKADLEKNNPTHIVERGSYIAAASVGKQTREGGEEYFVMNTLNNSTTTRAICSFVYAEAGDESWALETWKSLRPPAPPTS
jgi:hypothetical protein